MVLSGSYEAVIDRSRGDLVVVTLLDGDEPLDEIALDPTHLPEGIRHVGAEFSVQLAAGRLVDVSHDGE